MLKYNIKKTTNERQCMQLNINLNQSSKSVWGFDLVHNLSQKEEEYHFILGRRFWEPKWSQKKGEQANVSWKYSPN